MESNGLLGKFNHFAEKVMRIAQFQLLWIVFSLCGGIIFGVMPATAGLYSVMRKWMMGNVDNQSYVKVYWTTFRKEFWKANALGGIIIIISFLIYLNFSLIRFTHGPAYWFLLIFVFMLSLLFFILLLYIFPVYAHFDSKFRRYFSISLLIGISFPFHTLLMAVGYYAVYLLFITVPGLIPFFGVSLCAFLSMWVSMKVLKRIEKKEESNLVTNHSKMKELFQRNSKPTTNNKGNLRSST
ncbi:integral membrane protein [Neobacillus bataviensis LMG 21833]|uniref:Integral membrane protein n=1 Tax=Neobacillus bataviensis LMG 21833 TaxID=1117379 RepID=K6C264_9BACI|nr:YesL family protein [Neobacillus bataviensis]EKN65240.1 integral membrane protein [Neobacillus bataviensis LMG 21833]